MPDNKVDNFRGVLIIKVVKNFAIWGGYFYLAPELVELHRGLKCCAVDKSLYC